MAVRLLILFPPSEHVPLGIQPPPPVAVPPAPGFDEPVRAAVERWVNERAEPGQVDNDFAAKPLPPARPEADPRVGKCVRVMDTNRVSCQTLMADPATNRASFFGVFLEDGLVKAVTADGKLRVQTAKGTFELMESEVRFL